MFLNMRSARSRCPFLLVFLCFILTTLTTCGKDSPTKPKPPEPPPPVTLVPTRIEITPASPRLNSIGQTVQLTARVFDQNSSPLNNAHVAYSSNNLGVAAVSPQGLVTAVGNGVARITATSGSATSGISVTVMQSAGSIVVVPEQAVLMSIGATVQLTATVLDQEGQPVVGAMITWQSSNETVATVSSEGLVTAAMPGVANIKVSVGGLFINVSINVEITQSSDRESLISFYNQTNGDNWKHNTNWLSNKPIGEWYGVLTWSSNGRVTHLQLPDNNLSGPIPPEIGTLDSLRVLTLFYNHLTGEIPPEIGNLKTLRYFNLLSNQLTGGIPPEIGQLVSLDELWLAKNRLTGEIPREIGNLDNLRFLILNGNMLNGAIPAEIGQLVNLREIDLGYNELTGEIPPEIGQLVLAEELGLSSNQLTGEIPPEIGQLKSLKILLLRLNRLSGEIPPEIGQLDALHTIWAYSNQLTGIPPEIGIMDSLRAILLYDNRLTGEIPAGIFQMKNLEVLNLSRNQLTGEIPPEIGQLKTLESLNLFENQLTGAMPPEIGQLRSLRRMLIYDTKLSGEIPPEIGQLDKLEILHLNNNLLMGMLPPEMGRMESLRNLNLSENTNLSGPIPAEIANLLNLDKLILDGTQLCAPMGPITDGFLNSLSIASVPRCERPPLSTVFLTQVTRPVPLVEGEDALLRVFVIAEEQVDADMPQVRATFYHDTAVTHVVEMRAQDSKVPSALDEGSLSASANAIIPGSVVRAGLELMVEIDPAGKMDPSTGVPSRIPETGRINIAVQDVPPLDLTLIPFLWTNDPDHSMVTMTEGLTEEDDLFRLTRDLLPVREFNLTVYDPVYTSVDPVFDNGLELLQQVETIQKLDGRGGHYMGIIKDRGGQTVGGGAYSISGLYYDILSNEMVSPDTPDLMSYCGPPDWISDYFFSKMIRYRQTDLYRDRIAPASASVASQTLLLWGGVDGSGDIILNPAFVVDAAPSIPSEAGPYRITGEDAYGDVLFSVDFEMGEVLDGEGGVFAFTLPVHYSWRDGLNQLTLSGPEGYMTHDAHGDTAMAILKDGFTGKVRGFLRDVPVTSSGAVSARRSLPEPGLEMTVSRGVPEPSEW